MANPVLTIAGVDRTSVTGADSVTISRRLNQRSEMQAEFQVESGFRPVAGNPVLLSQDGSPRFGGLIEEVEEVAHPGTTALHFRVFATDYSRFLDKRLFTGTFEGQTLHAIMTSLYTSHLSEDGFAITGVTNPGPTISEKLVFNYNTLTEVLNKIALVTGFFWSVSPTKVISFSAFSSNPAPFSLSWTSANWRDLKIKTSLRSPGLTNIQAVRTEYRVSSGSIVENFTGDGSTYGFFVKQFISSVVSVTVGGVPRVLGRLGFDGPPGAFDCYYNEQGIGIYFYTSGTSTPDPPGSSVAIVVTYTAQFNNVSIVQDAASIAARAAIEGGSGKWEAIHEERNIDTEAALDAIAEGLLRQKVEIPVEIALENDSYIEPNSDDLEPGHRFSPLDLTGGDSPHIVNDDFIVQSIVSTWRAVCEADSDIWIHQIGLTNKEPVGRPVSVLERLHEMARIGPDATTLITESPAASSSVIVQSTITADTAIAAPTNVSEGGEIEYQLTQDGTGGWVVSWNAVFKGVTSSTVQPDASLTTIVRFRRIGSSFVMLFNSGGISL